MVTRVGGLASGMDIDSIVEKLMTAEKAPLNKLYQNKQKYEWQRDAYRNVNTQLKAFEDSIIKNVLYKKDINKTIVSSTNTAISATPTTASSGQTLSIDSVSQLAKAGNSVGGGGSAISAGTAKTTKLSDLNGGAGISAGVIELSVLQTDGSFKDVTVTINNDDTIDNVISKLKNGDDGKGTGLNAFYDQNSGKISLSTKATGEGKTFNYSVQDLANPDEDPTDVAVKASVFVRSGEDFFAQLGFEDSKGLVKNGANAKVTINGLEIERQSNTFEVDGFNVTLNNTYDGTNSQPITLTAKTDVNNMVDKIKAFVETYNGLIQSLTSLTKEQKYRDYAPLTDEQKKEMEEDEIKKWEEKAKSGLLRNDSIIQNALAKMRSDLYSKGGSTNPEMNMLLQIGITTSSSYTDNGKLMIDEDKLRAAIEKDPDAVANIFSGTTENPGLADKMRTTLKAATADIEKKAGKASSVNATFNIGRTLTSVEDSITNWKKKLEDIEDRYWKQFTAMENAISKANNQSSLFMNS